MGRRPGYHHSEETKARIAASVKSAVGTPVAVRKTAPQDKARVDPTHPRVDATLPAAVAPKDALDALVAGPLKDIIALMLWKNRHNEPELNMQLTERDMAGLKACCDYLGVVPEVRIVRPQGMPGHDAIPATRTRSAIPAAEPTPPKNYVVIALVERGTENRIVPVENNPEDWNATQEAKNFANARDRALQLAGELQRAAATGDYSSSVLNDAAMCLAALAR